MELVVDANVLVAGFIRFATTRELLLDERLTLWTPEHSLTEAERVLTAPRLHRKIGLTTNADIQSLLSELAANIRVASISVYQSRLTEAQHLAPHPADAPYLALALHLDLPLWSNDQDLQAHQQAVTVYTTSEVLVRLHRRSS